MEFMESELCYYESARLSLSYTEPVLHDTKHHCLAFLRLHYIHFSINRSFGQIVHRKQHWFDPICPLLCILAQARVSLDLSCSFCAWKKQWKETFHHVDGTFKLDSIFFFISLALYNSQRVHKVGMSFLSGTVTWTQINFSKCFLLNNKGMDRAWESIQFIDSTEH